MTPAERKSLTVRRSQIRVAMSGLAKGSRAHDRLLAELGQINRTLGAAQGIQVSEHAIVRFVERVFGISSAELSRKILPDKLRQAIIDANIVQPGGDGVEIPVGGDDGYGEPTHRVVIKDGVVTTVIGVNESAMKRSDGTAGKNGKSGLARAANGVRQSRESEADHA